MSAPTRTRAATVRSACRILPGREPSTLTITPSRGTAPFCRRLVFDPVAITPDGVLLSLAHPTATDDTDVGACSDDECAVQIAAAAAVPVDSGLGITVARVEAVESDGVTVVLDPADDTEVIIACGPEDSLEACPTTRRSGELRSRLLLGGEIRLPSLSVGVAAIDGSSAVLRLMP